MLDHVFLLSPIAGAHKGDGDGDFLEIGLDVLHAHFHRLANGSTEADLHDQVANTNQPPELENHCMCVVYLDRIMSAVQSVRISSVYHYVQSTIKSASTDGTIFT